MKNQHTITFITLALLTSSNVMARSTPVTVVNDANNPVPVEVVSESNSDQTGFRAVGISSAEVKGNEGVLELNTACSAEFPGSRMCTTVEIMHSDGQLPRRSIAWVNPVPETPQVVVMPDGTLKTILSEKVLGTVAHVNGNFVGSISCRGFSNHGTATTGIGITDDGAFVRSLDCNVARPVSCCGPVTNQ